MSLEHPNLPAKLGKYEIRSILGRGAMGVVFRAYDPRIDRIVALKAIEKNALDPERKNEALARFMTEARSAGRLMHPNVVGVFEFDEDDDYAFIAMEYIDGIDLKAHIDQHNGRLSLDEARSILNQLLAALEYSHNQGVVHRDIKPANVFMMRDGTVKLGDFGIAKLETESTSLTRVGVIMGTPNYMSPEHFGETELDGRSDLFSVGVMMYELLTGEKPFSGDIPTILNQIINKHPEQISRLNPTLPIGLDAVVRKAIAKDPKQRFATAAEFSAALEKAFSTDSRLRRAASGVGLTSLADRSSPGSRTPGNATVTSYQSKSAESTRAGQTGIRNVAKLVVSARGNADYRTIHEAVRHAQPHDHLLIEPGTYDESLLIDKPLVIIGNGPAETTILCSSTSHCLKIASDGVRVRNLTVRGKAAGTARPAINIGQGNALFEDCDISSRSRLCVAVHGRDTAPQFRNCNIHDSQGTGIHFSINSSGRLFNCSLSGHPKVAVRADKGANPEIVGGSVNEENSSTRKPGRSYRPTRNEKDAGTFSELFLDARTDALQGGIRGGLIGFAAGLIMVVMGFGSSAPMVGVGVGVILGFSKANIPGVILGCLAALVFLPLTLPELLTGMLLNQLGQFGRPTVEAAVNILDLLLKGGLTGAVTLVFSGAYLHLMERAEKR